MPPKDEVRPCASRSASHSSSELDADSVARGASEAGADCAEGPEASAAGCEPATHSTARCAHIGRGLFQDVLIIFRRVFQHHGRQDAIRDG